MIPLVFKYVHAETNKRC